MNVAPPLVETLEEKNARLERENARLEEVNLTLTRMQKQLVEYATTLGLRYYPLPAKGDVRKLVDNNAFPYLVRDDALSVISPTAELGQSHVIIQADNLPALITMRAAQLDTCDVIYIDPPYNTGKEAGDGIFKYGDRIISSKDPVYHSAWLSFMEPRLREAHEFLPESGVAIISIGDQEVAHLRLLLDEVFGSKNFVTMLVWAGTGKNDSQLVSNVNDYVFIYAKNREFLAANDVRWRAKKLGADDFIAEASRIWDSLSDDLPLEERAVQATALFKKWQASFDKSHMFRAKGFGLSHYNLIDETGRVHSSDNISWPGGGGPRYDVLHPRTGLPVTVPTGGWRFGSPERMDEERAKGLILFGPDEKKTPTYKRYLDETKSMVLTNSFTQDRRAGSKDLEKLIGKGADGKPLFNNPKDRHVLAQWIDYVTPQFRKDEAAAGGKPITVLDFFAGSGTTMHAVMDLNKADGIPRRSILVTNNEEEGTESATSETGVARGVTARRIRSAILGEDASGSVVGEGYSDSMHYYVLEYSELPIANSGDDVADATENITLFEASYDGLVSLSTGAHHIVELDDIASELRPHYAVFTNSTQTKAVLVWKSSEWAAEEPEALLAVAASVEAALPDAAERIIFAPGRSESYFELPAGWDVNLFPLDFIAGVRQTVEQFRVTEGIVRSLFGDDFDIASIDEED